MPAFFARLSGDSDEDSEKAAAEASTDETENGDKSQSKGSASPCPHCWRHMLWTHHKGRRCTNSEAVGGSCVIPSSHAWWCDNCKVVYCLACLSSLRKMCEELGDVPEPEVNDWQTVATKPKTRRRGNFTPEETEKTENEASALVDAFCQRRELAKWVRAELLAIPPQEVGAVLAALSHAIETNPSVDLRALLALKRSAGASTLRRLDERQSRKLSDWIASLQLRDVDRNELFAVISAGFDKSEVEHLMSQTNYANKCRQGGYNAPIAVACRIMTDHRVGGYKGQVEAFSRCFRLSRKSEQQLHQVGPKTGLSFLQQWQRKPSREQDLELLEREITKLHMQETSTYGKNRKIMNAPRVQDRLSQYRNLFNAYDDSSGDEVDFAYARPEEGRDEDLDEIQQPFDDDDDEIEVPLDDDSEDDFGPIQLAPLQSEMNFAKPRPGEESTVTSVHSQSSLVDSLCRGSEERPGKRVPVATHFVVVVDVSGSMSELDCLQTGSGKAGKISRIDAVFSEVRQLASAENARAGCEDKMSFITFSDGAKIHFQEKSLPAAGKTLQTMVRPAPEGRTFYAQGLRAAAACARKDSQRRPVDVIFLSDGEPSDPEEMLGTLGMELLPARSRHNELTVHCIGFGAGASGAASGRTAKGQEQEVFAFLQQLAQVGNGHFHRASTSVTSLRGAFRAVSSTIASSRTRSRQEDRSQAEEEAEPSADDPKDKKKRKKKDRVERNVTFELRNVIFDLDESDMGKRELKAHRIFYEFDGCNFHQKSEETTVFIRRNPFTKGGMRHCYGLRDQGLDQKERPQRMVAKKSKFVEEGDHDPLTTVDIYAKQTAVAHYYARHFRKQCRTYGFEVKLDFVPCYAYRPISAEDGDLEGFCGEQYVPGEFVKLTSNAGFVNREEYGGHAGMGAAFSHYSFEWSKGALLVADIQGVCTGQRDDGRMGRREICEQDAHREWLLSDPQVLTDGASYDFGRGDLGLKGMQMFFKSHKCNYLCKKLGLRDIGEFKEPTLRCYLPGSTNILGGLHGKEGHVVKEIRQKSGVSRVLLPREAYSEWMTVNIYATSVSQANRAIALIKDKVDELTRSYGLTVEVPGNSVACSWNAAYWRSKRVEWIDKSGGAQIALYRGGWMSEPQPEEGMVNRIYIFPKMVEAGKGQMGASNRERDLAESLIRMDVLGESAAQQEKKSLDGEELAKSIQEFVRKSGGQCRLSAVLTQFSKEFPDKSQIGVNRFKTFVLNFRHLLSFQDDKVTLPAAAPAIPEPQLRQENRLDDVTSVRALDWLGGTRWKEGDYHAEYLVQFQSPNRAGAFTVTKRTQTRAAYGVALHWDDKMKRVWYGEKWKWYLSNLTEDSMYWADRQGNTAYVWHRIKESAKAKARSEKAPVQGKEAWPTLAKKNGVAKDQTKAPAVPVQPGHIEKNEAPAVWQLPPAPSMAPVVPEPASADPEAAEAEAEERVDAASETKVMVWQKWFDHSSQKHWWCCGWDHSKWFYEDDGSWERYQVPDGHQAGAGRVYRWNAETSECFFEDTGEPMT